MEYLKQQPQLYTTQFRKIGHRHIEAREGQLRIVRRPNNGIVDNPDNKAYPARGRRCLIEIWDDHIGFRRTQSHTLPTPAEQPQLTGLHPLSDYRNHRIRRYSEEERVIHSIERLTETVIPVFCTSVLDYDGAAQAIWIADGLEKSAPGPQASSEQNFRPLGSVNVTGLLLLYAYPFICCGSFTSMIGSTDRNRPVAGSYSLAPRWVRPVVESFVPPTKPFSPAQLPATGAAPRSAPNGVVRRIVSVPVSASTAAGPVPCASETRQPPNRDLVLRSVEAGGRQAGQRLSRRGAVSNSFMIHYR